MAGVQSPRVVFGVKTLMTKEFPSVRVARDLTQCCQMAQVDLFLSLDCARVEGWGAQSKEGKGSNFAA